MTTQQPTQPETAQDPMIVRVARLEVIAEQNTTALNTMRGENHTEHQAFNDKIDRQGESLRGEIGALSEKVDRQGETLSAKVDTLRAEIHAKADRQLYVMLGAFATTWATMVAALFLTR